MQWRHAVGELESQKNSPNFIWGKNNGDTLTGFYCYIGMSARQNTEQRVNL